MERLLKNQQIPLVQVIDPISGQQYYAPESAIYTTSTDSNPVILKNVVVDQAASASYFSGSVDRAVSASYAATASYLNTLNQNLTFNGNLILNGTASISYLNVSYESASVIYSSGSNQFGDAANDTQTLYGSVVIPTGSLTVTGSVIATSFTGSLLGTSSFATSASLAATSQRVAIPLGSGYTGFLEASGDNYRLRHSNSGTHISLNSTNTTGFGQVCSFTNGVGITPGGNSTTQALGVTIGAYPAATLATFSSGSVTALTISGSGMRGTGSFNYSGNINATSFTGSLLGTSSYSSTSLSASYALTSSYLTPLNQQILLSGSLKFDPTQDPDPTGIDLDSTVLFQSSSNTTLGYDLYVRQNGNLVKWKWIEGILETGLLYGGVVTYSGSNVFVSPGSGIIAEHNATTGSEVSPMIEYVTWNAITQSITNIATQQVTYLYIDNNGALQQQSTRFTSQQYHSYIPLGAVGHFDYIQVSAFGGAVQTAYDQGSQTSNFIDAFGPLKMSGYGLTGQAGSLRLSVGSGTSFIHGGFYQNNPEFPSQITTPSQATASLARINRSGSVIEFDTNAGNLYTVVDPTKYDRDGDGTLANVGSGNWSIQRVFSDPKTGVLYVYYGQARYTSLLNALQFLPTDPFTEGDTFDFTTFVGFLVLKGNASDITDASDNSIINGGLFRGSGQGSGGGIALSNLEDLTDVSITSPTNGQALVYDAGIWINSYPASASYSSTASYVQNAQSASYVLQAVSASYATQALSASWAPGGGSPFPYTGSAKITGSLGVTGPLDITGSLDVNGNIGVSDEIADTKAGNLKWQAGTTFYAGTDDIKNNISSIVDSGVTSVNNYNTLSGWVDDIRYNGLVLTAVVYTSAGSVTRGQLVAMRNNGTWELADANTSNSTLLLGIALSDAIADGEFQVLLNGIYSTTYHNQTGIITPGYPLYISTTAGNVTETAPSSSGDYVRLIGHNIVQGAGHEIIRFAPDNTWIEL